MGSQSDNDDINLDFLPKDQAEKLKKMYSPEFFTPHLLMVLRKFNFAESLLKRATTDDVATSPLMQILSITLHKKQDDGTPSELYGTILIKDWEGQSFPIYDRVVHEPQRVHNGGRLMLSVPKDSRAIIPSNKVDIEITLLSRIHRNSDHGCDEIKGIVETSYTWDFTTFCEYDIPLKLKIDGAHGSVMVEYIVYRHAVCVTVDAKLLKKEGNDGSVNFAEVYGTISACWGNICSINLFEKEKSEAVVVEYGTFMELSSAVVVTPVWTQFVIKAELWSRNSSEVIVEGKTDNCYPIDDGFYSRMIEGKDNFIEVEVTWKPAFIETPTGNDAYDLFPVVKRMRVAPDEQALLAETIQRNLVSDLRKSLEQDFSPQFEVFSMSIHNSKRKEFNVWGSIVAEFIDSSDHECFKKEKTAAERLGHNQTISIMFPLKCIVCSEFSVMVDLKDEDDSVVSYGRICWSPFEPQTPFTSYGKKLCSVIVGDDGYYTALYCSIFKGGIQAVVKVHLIKKNSTMKSAKVHGCVRSQYSTFDYATIDDNEFYTRKLYARDIEDCALELAQSKTLLSESFVSVPLRCALLINVDLKVIPVGADFSAADSSSDVLRHSPEHVGRAVFSTADKVERWCSDETLDHQIEVYVEWKKAC